MSDFGGLIRDARERLGLSPHRVAELIGRAAGTVKAWERGRTVPNDPYVVTSLAAVLAIDEATLFRSAGLTPPGVTSHPTIEQELASIAPARPAPPPPEPRAPGDDATEATAEPAVVEHVAEPETPPPSPSLAPADGESPLEAIADLLQKGKEAIPLEAIADFVQKGKEAIVELGAPVVERLARPHPERPRAEPRPAPVQPVAIPTGSYLEDPEERWSYRLRTLWTAAGVAALGILLLWAGSRTLEALGDTWDALLSGL